MPLRIDTTARNAACDGVLGLLDGGTISVYTGAQPATPAAGASGTLLVTFTLPNPAFTAAVAGVATLGAVDDATAVATGTAGWFRATGAATIDGEVGTTGKQLNLASTAITTGDVVSISSGTVTMPSGA